MGSSVGSSYGCSSDVPCVDRRPSATARPGVGLQDECGSSCTPPPRLPWRRPWTRPARRRRTAFATGPWASSLRCLATCRQGSARGRRFLEQSVADAGFCLESVPSLPGTALFWPADAGRNPFQECHLSRLYHPALYHRDVPVGSYWEASAPPL